jgi:hypothetical protein
VRPEMDDQGAEGANDDTPEDGKNDNRRAYQ